MLTSRTLTTAVLLFLLAALPATAGTKEELIRLQSDVMQLATQIQLMQKGITEGNAVMKTLLEQLVDRVASLRVSLDGINQTLALSGGQAEVAIQGVRADAKLHADQLAQAVQGVALRLDDTNGRISALTQKIDDSTRSQARKLETLTTAGINVPADQLYATAYNDYLLGNYELAVQAFRDYLERFKDSEMADDALYYIGVSYLDEERYEEAVQAFDQLIQIYPKGNKLPTAHFKRALALQAMEKVTDAVSQFQFVYGNFRNSPEASLAEQELRKMGVEPQVPARTAPRRR